ncbi:M23 family metallopeptidase [Puniceibacterium sp. IMCC21224]|uniref:M23 family metallopeptidase n=1 Tax=Puniceibacterium sp. IMCC21224 TaxID=1618204 RepID=UPI00064DC363|nr:M23 family metallopeptidase [Puniceibacterium sp. IMCC21224]
MQGPAKALLATLILTASAAPTAAEAPFLSLPLDCTLGQTCFIEDYVDADPGIAQHDYTCGLKSRDGHRGTDIALLSDDAMDRGTAVLAAADGVVEAVRDGVPDRPYSAEIAAEIAGQECGNAVRILHPNGYQTLYCHMKRSSLAVQQGQQVTTGTPIGQVGMSGQSNFPHVHITVLKDGKVVDPFAPEVPAGIEPACGTGSGTLWFDPPIYGRTGLFTASFTTSMPRLTHVQSGAARRDSARPDHDLILYGFAFFAETGDEMQLTATGPDGAVFTHRLTIDRGQSQLFRAFGRHAPEGGWPKGAYTGTVSLVRKDKILALRQAKITVE